MSAKQDGKMNFWMCLALVIGNMIGSGVFFLPSSLAEYGGISLLGWMFSAVGALLLALVFSRLARLVKDSTGGPYAYTRSGLGEFAAFLVAWGYWISIWCANAGISVAFVGYLSVFFPILEKDSFLAVTTGLAVIWFLTWINTRGVRQVGKVQMVTTVLKLIPLTLVAFVAIWYLDATHFTPLNRSGESGFSAITASATLTLYAFLGMESATVPAGSVRDPEVNIPKATVYGTLVVIVVYVLGTAGVFGIIPPADLVTSNAPFADAAARIWGEGARYLVAGGVVVSTFGALNGWILLQGQLPAAAARDGLFPRIFERENGRGIPAMGLILSSFLISLLLVMNYTRGLAGAFKFMILLSTLTVLVPYLFSAATLGLLILQRKEQPGQGWLLLLAGTAFAYALWAVAGAGMETVYWGFLLLMGGLPIYIWIKSV